MMEIWKDVPNYEGLYQVSNFGRTKRLFKNGRENILHGRMDKDGYIEVILSKGQKKKFVRLHRLVAEVFVPNPENKPQVNHKDRAKHNNAESNLEWVTASENTTHTFVTGRKVYKRPIAQYTKGMEFVALWDSITEASKALNINRNNICTCCHGSLPSAGGYVWRYQEVVI